MGSMSTTQFLSPPSNDDFLGCFLGRTTPQVISLVGAGGKTSALFWLANALYQSGARVLLTTTTRMSFPDPRFGLHCIVEPDFQTRLTHLKALEQKPGITALFSLVDEQLQKVAGCFTTEVDVLKTAAVADFILVEADGANHLALKAPAEHEPCIPASSDVVIGLSGAEAIMRPAQPGNIHRWPIFSSLTGVSEGEILNAPVFRHLLTHPQGLFKNAPAGAHQHWLVNGLSTGNSGSLAMLESIDLADVRLEGIWLGNMRNPSPFTHAWVRPHRMQKDLR